MRFTWIPIGCALMVLSCGEEKTVGGWTDPLVVCADGATVEGVDVSYWDGEPDWDRVAAAGISFAFIRVSDGIDYPDDQFGRNWTEARRVGILRGAYQYFRPTVDIDAQVSLFLSAMGTLEDGDLPPVIDVEADGGLAPSAVAAAAQQWIDRVEAAVGRVPIIYTGKYFWQDNVGGADFTRHPLWIAQYGPVCPDLPDPWTDWVFFQYSDTGTVDGINAAADLDRFNGDLAALQAFASYTPVCGDGLCNGDETHDSCPGDCKICEPIPPVGRVVEDSELCFERLGTSTYWHAESAGSGGALWWTYATDSAAPDNQARWRLDFAEAGRYRLEAYTQPPYAGSRRAPYRVRAAGAEAENPIDQSAQDGFALVGEFDFAAGADQWVHLRDNTGEPYADRVQIAFDAIRLTRLSLPPDGGPEDGGPVDGGSADAGPGDGGPQDDGPADGGMDGHADAGSDGGADAGNDPGAGSGDPGGEGSSGCGCSGAAPGSLWPMFVMLAVFAKLLRRRGRV